MRTPAVWWRLCAVSAVAAVLTAILLAVNRPHTVPAPAPAAPTEEHTAAETRASQPLAYLGEWEGKLAVFHAKNAPPTEVYDVFVASLPPAEQQALQNGIPVFDDVTLQKRLEDYTG